MDNDALRDSFRRQLTNVHALTVLTVSLFEIVGYMILIRLGLEEFSVHNSYFWICVVLPIAVNLVTHLTARRIVNHSNIRRKAKNAAIIAATLITSFVVAVIHKEYTITSCAFVFPIMLSAMFNDRKLLNASFISSLVILVCVAIAFVLDGTGTLISRLSLFVLFAFSIVAYFCGVIFINFSVQNSMTIQTQAETNDKLQDDVLRDQMTGLYNHSAFVCELDRLIEHADVSRPFCLAMIDIDDFKKINDTYGHDCGDEVLIYLAQEISRHSGENDVPYRYGGEEFAIIFHKKALGEACAILNRLLESVRKHRFGFSDAPVTFSVGVREYWEDATANAFFESADQALYAAKKAGKNRISTIN